MIEELGITSQLTYDVDNYVVNFKNLRREFIDSIPVRPLYLMEEKKCQDVIEALVNLNSDKIDKGRIEMQKLFDESYRGNGEIKKAILSIMMWGPYADKGLQIKNANLTMLSQGHMSAKICLRSIIGCILTMLKFLVR